MSDIKQVIVYQALNIINNKKYIGKTIQSLEGRKSAHRYNCKKSKKHFYNAINKYGWDKFIWSVLFITEKEEEAKQKEIEYIAKYNTNNCEFGYNLTKGGDGTSGWHHSEEGKRNIGIGISGKNNGNYHREFSKEHRDKIGKARLGKKDTKETCNKRSEALKKIYKEGKISLLIGRKRSAESILKQSKSMMGKYQSNEKREKCKISKIGEKNPNYKLLSKEIKEKIILLFNENKRIFEIANELKGISRYKIKRFLIENNLLKN